MLNSKTVISVIAYKNVAMKKLFKIIFFLAAVPAELSSWPVELDWFVSTCTAVVWAWEASPGSADQSEHRSSTRMGVVLWVVPYFRSYEGVWHLCMVHIKSNSISNLVCLLFSLQINRFEFYENFRSYKGVLRTVIICFIWIVWHFLDLIKVFLEQL